jgi:hypothetical protein
LNDQEMNSSPILNNKQYNIAKFITVVVFKAIGTLYFALAQIWGLPAGEQILGSILAVETCLGVILGISSNQYNNTDARFSGVIKTTETKDKTSYLLELNEHPETLKNKDEAIFKVT